MCKLVLFCFCTKMNNYILNDTPSMDRKLAVLLTFVLVMGLVGNAYAHKMDVVGDTKIDVGWKNEPPVVGIENEIELTVTTATAFDKEQAMKMNQAMAGMDMGNMDMSSPKTDDYDVSLGPILSQFESGTITASIAINQISDIIAKENPNDEFGKEIKYLIEDVRSGSIIADDALYAMIGMVGLG